GQQIEFSTTITVVDEFQEEEDGIICHGDTYTLPDGTVVSTAGAFTTNLISSAGCDSTSTTTVIERPEFEEIIDAEICEGESYTLPDGTETSVGGSFEQVLTAISGCDSTITTNLTILPVVTSEETFEICEGESVTLPDGTEINTNGSFETILSSVVTGCDSIITTAVTINPPVETTFDVELCEGESITLPDGTEVNASGSYDVTLQSVVTGCDSTITTNVTVNLLLTSSQDFTICEGESVTLPDGMEVSASGSYDVTLQSIVTGCDSTITTNVIVNPLLTSTEDFTICEGESVTLPDGT